MNVGSDRVFTRFIPAGAGNTERRRLAGFARRFIPAGAGNTFADTGNTERLAVYPRWRGEHTDCGICSVQILGLSPLARGTLNHQPDHQLPHRFIPAGAGNTGITVIHWPPISVYPRWRGEHCNSLISDLPRLGLSPLARGTPVPGRGCISILRFIPAGAGNTRWIRVLHSTAAVYPRWRGEHAAGQSTGVQIPGLSPLARGTLVRAQ